MAKLIKSKKTKTPKITSVTIRENRSKDFSPSWEGHSEWDAKTFLKNFHSAMQYYNLQFNGKDLKPTVIKWMTEESYSTDVIDAFKKTKDWRCSNTMGALASCFLKGMPEHRDDFNNGLNSKEWLANAIINVIEDSKRDDYSEDEPDTKKQTPVVNIQERVKESAFRMLTEIEEAIETWQATPDNFDHKQFKVLNLLKGKEAKSAHAKVIKEYYSSNAKEIEEVVLGTTCPDLKEGYSHRTKKQIKELHLFYKEIEAACNMLMEEAKVTRKPRVKKSISKEKLIEKIKYLKTHDALKLVSINPIEIIGASELWIYNTSTRKIGRYIADELTGPLTIKGTTIVGFDENLSIQKTIRKPEEKLKEFKSAGKIALRKFLDAITTTDTKMNGRINEDTILLKSIS